MLPTKYIHFTDALTINTVLSPPVNLVDSLRHKDAAQEEKRKLMQVDM